MFKKYILPALITLGAGALWFYLALPPINLRSAEFWGFVVFLLIVYFVSRLLIGGAKNSGRQIFTKDHRGNVVAVNFGEVKKSRHFKPVMITVLCVAAVLALAIGISSARLFNASKYASMLSVQDGEFEKEISEINFSQIPVVDRDAADILGNRRIGQVVELVSQFEVGEYYTQININEVPYRVSPLEYAGFLKWIVNRGDGIPYYVKIDMSDLTAAQLVHLEQGMKYSPSEYFSRDLMRYVRFRYPTKMFEEVSFEVDDDGNPYWILSYYTYRIGLLGGRDIAGVIMVNAVTGETQDYAVSEVPSWVDRVYSANIVLAQAGYYGSLQNGFWNSMFVQKNVIQTTSGYNYLALEDDVWLYTGITSVMSDNSNIGFLLINMRTKEARRYTINGADEYSAMDSAEGKVQEKGYNATFPILVNIKGEPSYFISLKDNAGTIKAYSFVSVTDYQIVGVDYDSIENALNTYVTLLENSGKLKGEQTPQPEITQKNLTGRVTDISNAVVNGNTCYYIIVNNTIFIVPVTLNNELPFLAAGDLVSIDYTADAQGTPVTVSAVTVR